MLNNNDGTADSPSVNSKKSYRTRSEESISDRESNIITEFMVEKLQLSLQNTPKGYRIQYKTKARRSFCRIDGPGRCRQRYSTKYSTSEGAVEKHGTSVLVLLTLLNVDFTLAGWDQPISPKEYQKVIGQGFAASLFRGRFDPETNQTLLNYDRKFNKTMHKDVYDAGFRNIRLRCDGDLEGIMPFTSDMFQAFLDNLTTVVDDCLYYNVTPIISWNHKEYTANTSLEGAKANFIGWWREVARSLKKKDYRLSFNLITEINNAECRRLYKDCNDSLMSNPDIYNEWMKAAVAKIRATGINGNNADRFLILPSPALSGKGFPFIDESIYENDQYLMVEYHSYAAGPNKKKYKNGTTSHKYWVGNGTEEQRKHVKLHIQYGSNYTVSKGVYTYFGAWMPVDNKKGQLNQSEVINFARYMVQQLGKASIPWSLNSLLWYMDKKTFTWDKEPRDKYGNTLYMNEILEEIKDTMAPYTPYNITNVDR